MTNEGTIPGGLTESNIAAQDFSSDYVKGTTQAGNTVTITAGTFTVGSGFTASNYYFSGITGSGTVEVQKKRLTISDPVDSMGHITDNYGENVTTFEALADLFEAEGMSYVQGLYGSDAVTFAVTTLTYDKWYDDGAEGAWESDVDASSMISGRLYGNTAYNVGVKLASDNSVNNNYDLQSGSFVYAILPLPITVTGVELEGFDGDYIYDGSAHDIKVNYTGALDGDELEFTIDVMLNSEAFDGTALTDAGTYSVSVSFDPQNAFHGEANYNYNDINEDGSSNDPYEVTIKPFDLTRAVISITSEQFTYDGTEKTVEYTVLTAEGGKDITSMLTPAGNKQTNAGDNYMLTLTGGSNFIGSATVNWSIAKKDVTFAWSVSGEIVEGMAVEEVKALANETDNGGILEADTYTFGVDIGDYTAETPRGTQVTFTPSVTFTEEGDADNYNITFSPETEELIVQLGEVEIAVTQATVNADYVNGYTSAAQFLANFTTSVPEVTIDGENFTVTVTHKEGDEAVGFGSLLDVGEYTVTIESSVYSLAGTTTYAYQVTATVAEISWAADTDLIYNGAPHTLTATVANKVGQDDVTVTVQRGSGNNVNVTAEGFTFTATGLTGAAKANYTIDGASNLTSDVKTITPATLNITQTAEETLTRSYDGTTTEATSFLTEKYVTITGGVSGENIYGMLNAEIAEGGEIKNAGAYKITVTFNAEAEGAGNYSVGKFTSLEIVYTVTAKTITITFDGYEGLTYNGQARTLTATADFVSGENIDLNALIAYTGNVTDGKAVNAGSYTATITKAQIEKSNANYTLAAESATHEFTISPATLTLTQKEGAQLSRVYDGTVTEAGAFVSEAYFTVSGYVDGGNVYTLFTAAVAEGLTIQNADSYTINITLKSEAEGAGNYTCETFAISYEVTPIQWTASVAAPEGGLTYDGTDKLGSLVITGDNEGTGLEGAPVIAAYVEGGMINANAYTVTLRLQTAEGAVYEGGNFILAAESAEIVIAKRVVEIRWAEASNLIYNGEEHALTATVANKVEQDVVTVTVQRGSGDNVNVTAEGFTFTATGLTGAAEANYTIDGAENLTSKTQHISRATLTVQFEDISGLEYTGTAHKPTATATGWQKDESFDLNSLITIGGNDTQALNAGNYTATITKEALEAALGNYTLAQDASVDFTVAPATLNVSVAIAGDGVADNTLTWNVEAKVTVSGNSEEGWTLTSGETSYIVTVTGADGVASDVLQLTLNGSEYKGTPYGTSVQKGVLAVASTNPNYKVELVAPVIINIVPDISIEINKEYPTSAVYSKGVTYTAEGFARYFSIDGQPDGTWDYSVEEEESGSFSDVGTYTVKATFTITASRIQLETNFTFTITQATVTGVKLSGDGVYTYGELKAGDTVSVTVTYSDGNTATVNAGFDAAKSTGGFVKAGESVELTLTGDDGANANYAKVKDQTVTVSVSKAEITADISYIDDFAVEGVLTLPYIGSAGYSHNITVTLYGVLGDDVVEGELETEIINANTYGDLTFALYGDDSYVITNAADLSVVVTPAEITVEWSNVEGLTYNGSAQAPTATAKGLVDGDSLTLTVAGAQTNAGSYTATVAAASVTGNYVLAEDATVEFTIAPKSIGVEWTNTAFEYDGTAHKPTATATDLVGEDTFTLNVTGEQTNANAEGEHYTATVKAFIDGNYKLEQDATVEFTIARKTVSVAWGNTEFTYNGSAQVPTATATDLVDGDSLTLTVTGAKKDVGTYTATVAAASVTGNYVLAADATVDFTIEQLEVVLKWKAADDLVYNGAPHELTATVNNKQGDDDVTVIVGLVSGNDNINVGEFFFEATGLTGTAASNYKLPENAQSQAFNVKPAQVKITWNFGDGAKITYGDSVDAVKALVNIRMDGPIPGVTDPLAFEVSVGDYSATTNAGTEVTFTVTAKLPEGAKEENYNINITAADGNKLNVGKATLTLDIAESASLTKVYDGDAVTLGSLLTADNVSVKGMKNDEDAFTLGILAISGTDEMTNAGAYSGSVSVIDDCNYTAEPLQFSYKITPKPIGVAWSNTEFTYDGTAHKPTATATDLVDGDSLTLTVTGAQTNAGSYTATVAADSVTGNYVLAEDATVEFTIAPKSIGVEWTNTAFTYDGTAHKPTATATDLVDGDSLTLTVTGEQTNAGSYTATVAAFEQGNYKLESTSTKAFTIAKRGLDVAEVAEAVYGDLQVSGTLVTGTHTAFVAYNDEEIELIVNVKAAVLSRAAAEYLDAGEHEVTIALANENGNFSLNGATLNPETEKMEVQSTLDVAPKSVTVGYTPSSEVYDAKGISLTLGEFEDMLIEGDDPAVNIYINDALYTGKVVLDAGEYTVRYESADPNYAFAPVSATFTVAPKKVTPNFDLNTGSGSQQITGGGKLEIEEGEETDIVAAIDSFMQSSGVSEEEMSISVSGDLKLEDMATWAPGTYTVTVTLSGNYNGSMEFTVEVSEKVELPPPVEPELPETPAEAGSGNDWVLPLVIAIVALIDLALLVAIGVAAKKRA